MSPPKRIPGTTMIVNAGPPLDIDPDLLASRHALAPRSVQVRIPVLEQLGVQLGGSCAWHERGLCGREIAVAQPVFQDSIDLSLVRVVTAQIANAPTTLGNVIRTPPLDARGKMYLLNDTTLVHELTHVWQYQTRGSSYISSSLLAQGITEGRDGAYVLHASQLLGVGSIYDLSAERQARVVELYFVSTLLQSADPHERQRARFEFGSVLQCMTDPDRNNEQFALECRELSRLIAQVRRACPLTTLQHYEEALHGLGTSHDWESESQPAVMPLFRIDF